MIFAGTVKLILVSLILAAAFAIAPTKTVAAVDILEGTCWSDDSIALCFQSGGVVKYEDMFDAEMTGSYELRGNSLTVAFRSGQRAIATVDGNKISGKWSESPNTDPFDFTLTKEKRSAKPSSVSGSH